MNRRNFIKRLAGGIVGTAVALHLDVPSVIVYTPRWLQQETALSYLRRLYNAHCQLHGKPPLSIVADRHLYDTVEGEMNQVLRFGGVHQGQCYLWFKGSRLYESPKQGWGVEFVA